jgi:hypothetical protein
MTGRLRIDARQFVLDMFVGLALVVVAMVVIVSGSSPAGAVETAVLTLAESRWVPLSLIAGLFSLVLAFNLALYRHVRRVYAEEASRDRRSGRRGQA